MKRICSECQTEMIGNCKVNVEGAFYGITIEKKRKGLFSNVSAKLKVAVCTNCGNIVFYIDEYKDFTDHIT